MLVTPRDERVKWCLHCRKKFKQHVVLAILKNLVLINDIQIIRRLLFVLED